MLDMLSDIHENMTLIEMNNSHVLSDVISNDLYCTLKRSMGILQSDHHTISPNQYNTCGTYGSHELFSDVLNCAAGDILLPTSKK